MHCLHKPTYLYFLKNQLCLISAESVKMRNDLENAIRRKNKLSLAAEVFLWTADELADSLLIKERKKKNFLGKDILHSEEFLKAYTDLKESLTFEKVPAEVPEETSNFLSGFRSNAECFACAYLLSAFCKKRSEAGKPITFFDFLGSEGRPDSSKIAYMRNSYADTAYEIFSSVIKNASVLYPSSFAAACEEVYYGRVGYCILPYETSEEGVLSGFRRLISKYELSPVLTCSVVTDPSLQNTTRFVLLAKSAFRVNLELKNTEIKFCQYLKISIGGPQAKVFGKVLAAATFNQLSCVKTESVPLPWDDESYSSSLTFSVGNKDIVPFLLYLKLEVPESEIEGIFADIEDRSNIKQ